MERYRDELDRLRVSEAGKQALMKALTERQVTEKRRWQPSRALRPVLIAACLAGLLAVGVMASGFTGAWQRFFPGKPGSSVTQVDVSATTGDYTLTLEEAIVDEDAATFLLALRRTDGGVLEGKPRLNGNTFKWDVKVDGEYPNMGIDSQQPILSEDGTAVYYCVGIEIPNADETLVGRDITFVCKGVADMDWSEAEIAQVRQEKVSLASIADGPIPLAVAGGDAAYVSQVIFTNNGLNIALVNLIDHYVDGQYLTVGATPKMLTDIRTGERWGVTALGMEGETYLAEFEECPLTEEALPYLELTVGYQMDKVLSDERVELTFRTEKGGGVTKEINREVAFDTYWHYEGRLTSARLSSMKLRLNLENAVRGAENDSTQEDTGRLVMKDGKEWALRMGSDYMNDETGGGYLELDVYDDQDQRALVDPAQVKSLKLGGQEIDLS